MSDEIPQEFKIEKGIPFPDRQYGQGRIYPFGNMEVGDSFFVPATSEMNRVKISAAASGYGAYNNRKFTVRKTEGGFRIWRTA